MTLRPACAALALCVFGASSLIAQRPETGAFLVRLGNDTVSIESFTRTASRMEVDQVYRPPRTLLRHYTLEFGSSGAVARAEIAVYRPGAPADQPLQRVAMTFRSDSVTVENRQGENVRTRTVAVPAGVIPYLYPAYSPLELLTEKASREGQDSVTVQVFAPSGSQANPVVVRRVGRDSMTLQVSFGTIRARVDRSGRFLGSVAPEATIHNIVERISGADIRSLALAFAARDSAGQAMGVLSPRDTVRAVVGGANLMVDYGRPFKRGREVFGGIVPWNQVWRTGANAATQFRTERDLVIGGLTVPAGTHTLWSLPSQSGWKLIINKQTGQWGTEYHEAQDLARIDMQAESLAAAVEQFTIAIASDTSGGVLRLSWDQTQVSVRFTVR